MKKRTGPEVPQTTAQQLGSLIKSAQDIMCKDKELSGDLNRLPTLSWIMSLHFLDERQFYDVEHER